MISSGIFLPFFQSWYKMVITMHQMRKADMKKKIYMTLLVISMLVLVIAGYNVLTLYMEYRAGINEYEDLAQYVSVEVPEEENVVEEVVETEEKPSLINVSLDIDYAGLKEINGDFAGWLYYEPLEISYPIVRGQDNDYYTKYTFEREKNKSGAIFMDAYNWIDYADYNTFIYGHNMRNGTMFGKLKKLLNDEEGIVEANPYFYIFTEEKAYMYEIFAVYNTRTEYDTYDLIHTKEEQEANLESIRERATWMSDKEVTGEDKIVTLSTCYGVNTRNRTVVQGVLIAAE